MRRIHLLGFMVIGLAVGVVAWSQGFQGGPISELLGPIAITGDLTVTDDLAVTDDLQAADLTVSGTVGVKANIVSGTIVESPIFDGGAGIFTTVNTGSNVVVGDALTVTNLAQVGALKCTDTKTVGTITLAAGTGTATVNSGALCVCTDSTANNSVKCAVSGSTLTATGTGTDAIIYICITAS